MKRPATVSSPTRSRLFTYEAQVLDGAGWRIPTAFRNAALSEYIRVLSGFGKLLASR